MANRSKLKNNTCTTKSPKAKKQAKTYRTGKKTRANQSGKKAAKGKYSY